MNLLDTDQRLHFAMWRCGCTWLDHTPIGKCPNHPDSELLGSSRERVNTDVTLGLLSAAQTAALARSAPNPPRHRPTSVARQHSRQCDDLNIERQHAMKRLASVRERLSAFEVPE